MEQRLAPAPRAPTYTPEGNLILTRLPVVSSSTAAWDTLPGSPDMIGAKRETGQPGRIDYWFHDGSNMHAVPTEVAVLKTRRSDHNALLLWGKVRSRAKIAVRTG